MVDVIIGYCGCWMG